MPILIPCGEGEKTICRVNLDNVTICFIVFFSTHIKLGINCYFFKNSSILVDHYEKVIKNE